MDAVAVRDFMPWAIGVRFPDCFKSIQRPPRTPVAGAVDLTRQSPFVALSDCVKHIVQEDLALVDFPLVVEAAVRVVWG